MSQELDLLAATVTTISEDKLEQLTELVNQQQMYLEAIGKLEERVKNGKKLVRQIEEELIPSVMQEVGMSEYKLGDGTKVKISSVVAGRIPSQGVIDKAKGEERERLIEMREEGMFWLENHGGDAIIKRNFAFNLGKDSSEIVESLIEVAKEKELEFDNSETVHAGSLNAFLKESLENGVDIPEETFGLFVGDKAKIVKPKIK